MECTPSQRRDFAGPRQNDKKIVGINISLKESLSNYKLSQPKEPQFCQKRIKRSACERDSETKCEEYRLTSISEIVEKTVIVSMPSFFLLRDR